ncbi:phage tail protein [Pseudoduganella aquatica]|uniref:phage tail protein n=1 Tax=Pseudoduganella aquatica TaxID=2660641 RepID=UPI001E3E6843|nr:tail fiber protein [Pseudoduganella aquatica]
MSDQFVAEIRMFSGNFAPTGWAMCNGQLLPISQNTALFSLLGTTYGGDGRTTFALPDLTQRIPIHPGQGPGLSERFLGEEGGEAAVTLTISQLPGHSHAMQASSAGATLNAAGGNLLAKPVVPSPPYHDPVSLAAMPPGLIGTVGTGVPHNNLQPFLVVNFIIALQGIFPPRS